MKVTICNHFHNTRASIYSAPGRQLTESQEQRLRKELCGMKDCNCGALLQGDGREDDYTLWHDEGMYFVSQKNLWRL